MEYFIVYDMNDNIVCYIDTKEELSVFTGLPIKRINYRFKYSNFINTHVDNLLFKIYKFV